MRAHAIFYRILFFLRLSTTKQIDKQAYSKSSEKVSYQMKHRFLIHSLSHTILVVDITQFGLQIEINARTGNMKMIPALRFPVWKEAEQYFRAKGADSETLEETTRDLRKTGVTVMTIV